MLLVNLGKNRAPKKNFEDASGTLHQDQNVCASSKRLNLELCRWVRKDNVKSILFEKMRDTMVS